MRFESLNLLCNPMSDQIIISQKFENMHEEPEKVSNDCTGDDIGPEVGAHG